MREGDMFICCHMVLHQFHMNDIRNVYTAHVLQLSVIWPYSQCHMTLHFRRHGMHSQCGQEALPENDDEDELD